MVTCLSAIADRQRLTNIPVRIFRRDKELTMHWTQQITNARVVCEPVAQNTPGSAQRVLDLLCELPDSILLDSSAKHTELGRYTIAGCCCADVLTLEAGKLTSANGTVLADGSNRDLWRCLHNALEAVKVPHNDTPVDYLPGWLGYVGYETARHIEKLPATTPPGTHLPDMRLGFYDALLVCDHQQEQWYLLRLDALPNAATSCAADKLRSIAKLACNQTAAPAACLPACDAQHTDKNNAIFCREDIISQFTPEQYRNAVAKCIDYIAAGDIFQVNLSQRFTVKDAPQPLAIYKTLRNLNPAWYSAWMAFEHAGQHLHVLSASPELFLRVRDRKVTTRPIKGTRRRTGDAAQDALARTELLASDKDNAELAMIVDLLRNDLGRICLYGTVKVTDPCTLETHPTVFHLAATIEGSLADNAGPAELLKATFPGGSITGAPKIRAMQIIDELEPHTRGIYTGSICHFGVDGACEMSIVIRTIVCEDGVAHVQAGGGIVADSTPDGEYRETLDKARAALEAISLARNENVENNTEQTS